MIRLLLGLALPVLGIGASAAFLGPDLLTGPRGEPLVMAAPDRPMLQAASFEGGGCASTTILPTPSEAAPHGSARIVAFALPAEGETVAVAVEDFPGTGGLPETVILIFDRDGRLIAAGDPMSLQMQAAMALADCIEAPKPDLRAPI
jgi:hypothetical protein